MIFQKPTCWCRFSVLQSTYNDVTKEYADDTGYTVDYDNTQSKDDIVLKKDGQKCNPDFDLQLTDENGIFSYRRRYQMADTGGRICYSKQKGQSR